MQVYKYYLRNVSQSRRPKDIRNSYLITTNIHHKNEVLGKKWLVKGIEITILNKHNKLIAVFSVIRIKSLLIK